jgi:hypothetical protein
MNNTASCAIYQRCKGVLFMKNAHLSIAFVLYRKLLTFANNNGGGTIIVWISIVQNREC